MEGQIMLKPYLLLFDVTFGSRQEILDHLNTCQEVKNWFAAMPTAINIISDKTPDELRFAFQRKFPSRLVLITTLSPVTMLGGLIKQYGILFKTQNLQAVGPIKVIYPKDFLVCFQ